MIHIVCEISNTGGLLASFPKGKFGTLSWPRNRLLADLLSRTHLMEKVGTGIKRIKDNCQNNGNPIEIQPYENLFFVEMKEPKGFGENGEEKSSEKSSEKILELIKADPKISSAEIASRIGLTSRAVEKNIASLKTKGLLKRVGPDKGGYWEIIKK